MPPALSPKDSYKREVLQGKMWRLTPGEKQSMGRKPSRSAEQREVHFLELGAQSAGEPAAQPSQHLHSPLRMSLASQGQTTWPFTASPPSPLEPTQTSARQTPEVCYLFLPDKDSSFTKHMVFPYCCISSIRVWGVSCFGSAAPSADNTCHWIHRHWHVKCPSGKSPIIMSLASWEQSSDSTVHATSGRNLKAFLLHLMSLAGIEFQSTHTAFHWQMMKNNGQLLYLDFTQGRDFPRYNLNKVPEAETTRQEESKYLKEQVSTKYLFHVTRILIHLTLPCA